MTKEELKSTAAKVAEAPSCYPGLKALIEAWQAAIGTAGEKAAAEKMLAGLKECVTPIDGLIAFAGSPNGEKILGKDAAVGMLKAAKEAKAKGEDTCICPACQNGLPERQSPAGARKRTARLILPFTKPGRSSIIILVRDVAQFGSALPWGGRGRGFKSRRSDHFMKFAVAQLFAGQRFFVR